MLVALLAITLLALTMILSIAYYYGIDQRNQLITIATEDAAQIGMNYASSTNLSTATAASFSTSLRSQQAQNQGYAVVVLNRYYDRVYPLPVVGPLRALTGFPKATQGRIRIAIFKAQQGIATDDDLGGGLGAVLRPFVAVEAVPGLWFCCRWVELRRPRFPAQFNGLNKLSEDENP
jgi:hypothetical protein